MNSAFSFAAMAKWPGRSVYTASKAAVDMITKMVAIENPTLLVNSICLGEVVIGISDEFTEEMVANMQFTGRFGRPDETANLISFLVSNEASFITRSLSRIDGGDELTGSAATG